MTNDEINRKQKETLEALNKYNKERKTAIVDEPDASVEDILSSFERGEKGVTKPSMQEWLDAQQPDQQQDELSQDETVFIERPKPSESPAEDKLIMSHICPYCGTMAYIGQIHGLGYCKEKVQYEQ